MHRLATILFDLKIIKRIVFSDNVSVKWCQMTADFFITADEVTMRAVNYFF